jgi:multidrug efflux system membrane fusion protein
MTHQTSVNNLQNKLDLIPSQKNALKAQKKSGESTVEERTLNVAKTEIRAPFHCRLSAVNIELSQFAAVGSVLVVAQSVDKAEIPVSVTPKGLLTLLPHDNRVKIGNTPTVEDIRKALDITAKVRLPINDEFSVEWDGIFSRTSESMDLKTGAIAIFITVDNPYEDLIPGQKPPLMTNMYVEVELQGRPLQNRWVVPRSVVHEGKVYICTKENRLEIRDVKVEFNMGDLAVISHGLKQGESLVLADLIPAIEGMLLKPVRAQSAEKLLKQQALGETK